MNVPFLPLGESVRSATTASKESPANILRRARLPRMHRAWLLIALAWAGMHVRTAVAAPLGVKVRSADGWVEGTRTAGGVLVFRGIRYAQPPVGDLRWRAPVPPKPWAGIRSAREFSPDCPQPVSPPLTPGNKVPSVQPSRAPGQSEDCLALNIWTPAHDTNAHLPVMVWIYGGGFQGGSGALPDYDGTEFARGGVVLVTFNYRVGVLGFLVYPGLTAEAPYHSSGNYGILDQIAALRWVKRNIAAFGGDPTRVTIFGESAGSTSVNILQASPLAKGLFERTIGESTSQMDAAAGLLGRLSLRQAEEYGERYAAAVGAHSLRRLRRLSPSTLLKGGWVFWPLDPDGYVLPEEVYATFQTGRQNDVPTLVGYNAAEGVNLRVPWIRPETPWEKAMFHRLYPYPGDVQVYTDTVAWQMESWAELQARTGHHPSYLYEFDHSPPAAQGPSFGPIHAAEIDYVFRNFNRVPRPWTREDRYIGKLIASYWINFARSGNPNGPGLPHWPAFNPAAPELMKFDSTAHAVPAPRQDAFKFIDAYFARRRVAHDHAASGRPRG
jgi:para-nitrobenzyl esterase